MQTMEERNDNVAVPRHVTIIMDGNGRWAKSRGEERIRGHYEGAESVRACCEFAVEKGIRYLSVFAFSEENWNRPEEEVLGLMKLMLKCVIEERATFLRNGVRFRVIGDRSRLGAELAESIAAVERETLSCARTDLILLLSYSGKWDILQAADRCREEALEAVRRGVEVPAMTQSYFESHLATAGIPDPDLMIRTSGEQRISNYMLWQCAYTEFYFTDVLWPDFRKEQFAAALDAYASRERRFGKIK